MASLFARYRSTEEYYDIDRRIRGVWWGRPFDRLVNSVLRLAGTPRIAPPEGRIAIDMHVHTLCSYCSFTRPEELLRRAALLGLAGVCIMDHHTARGYGMALEAARPLMEKGILPEDFLILKGIEYSTAEGHICGLFCDGDVPFKAAGAREAVDMILDMGGLPIAAHPFHRTGIGELAETLEGLAGVEIYSGSVLREQEYLRGARITTGAARLGSSDSHFVSTCGMCYTLFPDTVKTPEDVRRSILAADTEPAETACYTSVRRLAGGMK
ncbi:MAG: PHP domain-containing protein [Abditibacteriota bacterium]|nr:PHP domain-containing protein [Abditibacteriota bacterium]